MDALVDEDVGDASDKWDVADAGEMSRKRLGEEGIEESGVIA